jgi:uncharacterized repeat protein (TIGR03803 family)
MIALKSVRPIVGKCSLLCALLGVAAAGIPASAQTLIPLVSLNYGNGAYPSATLIADGSGNLFGTTENGGAYKDGTVFEIPKTTSGYASTPVTLVSFNGSDGKNPVAGLIADGSGNLFGTTAAGGASGEGTVFEIAKTTTTATGYASTPVTLVSFNYSDGAFPSAGLIADGSGNLFGTTLAGGAYGAASGGYGTVFEIAKTTSGYASTPTTLVSFNETNGANPYAALIADGSGNLFGTTAAGGASGDGTVFEITKTTTGYASTPVTLVSFTGTDGAYPYAALIADGSGNLFGTTEEGGAYGAYGGYGTAFEIAKTTSGYASTPVTLVSFNASDGAYPVASLIADGSGNLFGTTVEGGTSNYGTVFEIAKTTSGYASTPATLVSFNGSNGADPYGSLIADGSGNLFGTTAYGGASGGNGTVFEITNSGFVPVRVFAGIPGSANCVGASTSSLAHTYGGIAHAASALGYNSVSALKSAITTYCSN